MVKFICRAKKTLFFAITAVLTFSAANAEDAMLTLTNVNNSVELQITEEGFLALDQITMNTVNEYVDAITAFTGPLARDVVALLGADPDDTAILTAANDYSIEVPVADFLSYNVVFAHSADGERFSMRDKGPVWVVYPMSDHPELQDKTYNSRLIWQLVSVEIK